MLKSVRELIEKGDFYRATMLANTFFGGENGGISGLPCRIDSYQPVGDLKLEFKNSNKFCERQLNIINGVAETERLTEKGKVNAVYTAHAINKNIICHIEGETNAEQFEAAKKSFDFRMKNGGGYTGWSRAWCACLCARFADSEKVYENISEMIKEFATASLLDLHPPGIFQIDGNLGAVAAVTEAAAQFVGGKLYLLKALPKQWANGSIENLRVPGGHKISFAWEGGAVKTANITIGMAESLEMCVNGKKITVSGACGDVKELNF